MKGNLASNDAPDVSIIIPANNPTSYLIATVESALAQTGVQVEVVVVDDGSDDPDSLEVLRRVKRLHNVQLLTQPRSGVSAARNAALALARGHTILPLDADDLLEPTYAHQAHTILKSDRRIAVVSCNTLMFGSLSGRFGPDYSWPRLLHDSIVHNGSAFRREDAFNIGGYDVELALFEDQDFFVRLLAATGHPRDALHQIPSPLYRYRKWDGSVTANTRSLYFKEQRALALSKRAPVIAAYPADYLEFLDARKELFQHFRRRYGKVERLINQLGRGVKRGGKTLQKLIRKTAPSS